MTAALWLLPAPEEAAALAPLLAALGAEVGAPPLWPHLTVRGGLPGEPRATFRRAREAGPPPSDLSLPVVALVHARERFLALHLRLGDDPWLVAVRRRLAAVAPSETTPPPPHLSLLYGELLEPRRAQLWRLAQQIGWPPLIRFDRLALVEPHGGDWSDLGSWRTLGEEPLAGVG